MHYPKKIIEWLYVLLFALTPLIFLPWTSELFEFNKLIVTYILTVLICAAWAIRCILEKKLIFKRTLLDIPLLLFLIINLISLIFSIDQQTSLLGYYGRWNGGLLSLVSYALLYWAFVSNLTKKNSNFVLRISCFTAGFVAVYGILQHFGIDATRWVQDVQTRVFSTLGQPNWLAAYLVALIFIPITYLTLSPSPTHRASQGLELGEGKRSWERYFAIVLFILLFICLLFTKSRSGLLAFGIGSTIYWVSSFINHKSIFKNPLIISAWILIISLTLVVPNPVRDILIKSNTPPPTGPVLEQGGTESGEIRKIVWEGAINAWQATPKNFLIGSGVETFAMIYYEYRPLAHNFTSEWELLYNKAHNEYLNYLTTTGILGLASYLILISVSLFILHKSKRIDLLAGYITILITNFWGFSVVVVQLLMFLLPALAISLEDESVRVKESKQNRLSGIQIISIFIACSSTLILLYSISKYWLADYHYAQAQKFENQFNRTSDPQSLVRAFNDSTEAYNLNSTEPFISNQLGGLAAYLAIFTIDSDSTSSAQLMEMATKATSQALQTSPAHPSQFKTASQTYVLLSTIDQKYLTKADEALQSAQKLSPTDPRIPFNRGVIAKYTKRYSEAKALFELSLKLKPDFNDAKLDLAEVATMSGTSTP